MLNDDDECDERQWFWTDLAEHLAEGQVLVVMTAGAENLRYITGDAIAISWDGRQAQVNINDIYSKAATEFGVPLQSIAPATYQDLPELHEQMRPRPRG